MSGWKAVALGDVADSVDYGVTASAVTQPIGPKFLRITDIQDGAVDWGNVPYCKCDVRSASQARLKAGDIVFARTGATTGKSFLIRDCPSDAVFASYLIRVRLGKAVEPNFVSHFFQTPNYWAQITQSARGLAQPGVNATRLKGLRIPLPPPTDQRRIAEILDKADALRAKRRAAIAQLDTLTQSIFLDMFGDPATNPKGWPEVLIGDHASKIGSGSTPLGGEEVYKTSGIALIRSMNVRDGTFLRDGLAFIDNEQAGRLDGVVVEADDVLLNITGASVARVCRAPADILPARVNQHVAIIRPTVAFNSLFLEQCLLSPAIKQRLLRIARAGATREAITKSAIEEFSVVSPPRELQDKFAGRVNAGQKTCRRMHAALAEMDALFASLQQRAFRGEL